MLALGANWCFDNVVGHSQRSSIQLVADTLFRQTRQDVDELAEGLALIDLKGLGIFTADAAFAVLLLALCLVLSVQLLCSLHLCGNKPTVATWLKLRTEIETSNSIGWR